MSLYKGNVAIAGMPTGLIDTVNNKASINLDNLSTTGEAEISAIASTVVSTTMSTLYPVGSLYLTANTSNVCPLASIISGSTWQLISTDRVLQGATNVTDAGTTKAAGLPEIFGSFGAAFTTMGSQWNAFTLSGTKNKANLASGTAVAGTQVTFNASNDNSIYGSSETVQPPAYLINVWQRTA